MRAILLTLALSSSIGGAGLALAQSVAMPPHPDINVADFSGDPKALPGAVAAIEAASGGRVVEIRYNNVSGVPGYDVVVAKGSQVSFQRFSKPDAGLVALTGKTQPEWMLKWQARRDVDLVEKAKVPLSTAIRTAESSMSGAPAVAAGIAQSASRPDTSVHAYNVAILEGKDLRRVAVDSDTGQTIDDPSALAGW
jgi:hypothetical protein